MSPATAEQPFILPIRVERAMIDAQGHVSNVAFLDWMNQAAIAHSAAVGFEAATYRAIGAMFVVRRHEIDYVLPAFEGEDLLCRTWCELMRNATALRRHEIVRAADGATLARGVNTWAFVRIDTGRPTRIPSDVVKAFTGADGA